MSLTGSLVEWKTLSLSFLKLVYGPIHGLLLPSLFLVFLLPALPPLLFPPSILILSWWLIDMWGKTLKKQLQNSTTWLGSCGKAKVRKAVQSNVVRLFLPRTASKEGCPLISPCGADKHLALSLLPWGTGRLGGSFLAPHPDMILLKHGLEGQAVTRREGLGKNYLIVFYWKYPRMRPVI